MKHIKYDQGKYWSMVDGDGGGFYIYEIYCALCYKYRYTKKCFLFDNNNNQKGIIRLNIKKQEMMYENMVWIKLKFQIKQKKRKITYQNCMFSEI